jgi:hypothetical protein
LIGGFRVQSTVMGTALMSQSTTKSKESTLDQALELIKGPQTINTVAKSSIDWENFKEKEGLQDDLTHSKEKYVLMFLFVLCLSHM